MTVLELLGCAKWQSKDWYKSEKAVSKITDQRKLAKIAKRAPHPNTRAAAIIQLEEQHQILFADIAKNDNYENVGKVAVKKLINQELLADVTKNAKRVDIREEAFYKLDEQQHQILYAEIAKKDDFKNISIRLTAVRRLDKQQYQILLADIAKNDKIAKLRCAALEKLDVPYQAKQNLLADIVKNDNYLHGLNYHIYYNQSEDTYYSTYYNKNYNKLLIPSKTLISLRELMTDQTLLADVAQNAKHWNIRKIAIGMLDEKQHQMLFIDIAKNDNNTYVCLAAIEKLDELYQLEFQSKIVDIAKNDNERDAGKEAIKMLAEQTLLADIAKKDYHFDRYEYEYYDEDETDIKEEHKIFTAEVGLIALYKLTDQALLADVAKNAEHHDVRKAAIMKLNECQHQALLIEIAKNGILASERFEAIKKLNEQQQALFADIAKNTKEEEYVRVLAIEKLNEHQHQTLFAKIAENTPSYTNSRVLNAIVERLDTQHQVLLANIAKKRGHPWYISEKAAKKLTDPTLLADVAKNASKEKGRFAAINKLNELQHQTEDNKLSTTN